MRPLGATPKILDFDVYRGDGFAVLFNFTSDGEPWPLAGTWEAHIRERIDAADLLDQFTIDDSEAAEGSLRIALSSVQTAALEKTVVWDLQQTDGEPRTWYRGSIYPSGDVTRG